MERAEILNELKRLLTERADEIGREWAAEVVALPGFLASPAPGRSRRAAAPGLEAQQEEWATVMAAFLPIMADHLSDPEDQGYQSFLREWSTRCYQQQVADPEVMRSLRLLKRCVMRHLVAHFRPDSPYLSFLGDLIEEEIDEYQLRVLQFYHELAEERFRESESLARALLEHTSDAIFLLDAQTGQVLQANSAAEALSGYSREELQSKFVNDFVPLRQVGRMENMLRQAGQDGPVEAEGLTFQPREGPPIPIDVKLCGLYYYQDKRAIQAIVRDVKRRWEAEQEAAQRAQQLATLNEIAAAINANLDLQATLRAIVTGLQKLVDFDRISIALLDEDGKHFRFYSSAPQNTVSQHEGKLIRRDQTILNRVVEERRPLIMGDLSGWGDNYPADKEITSEGIRSHICLPLEAGERVVGTFNLCSRRAGAYSEKDQVLLQEVAGHLAIAVQNARLFEVQQRRAQLFALIHQISSTALGELSVDSLLRDIAQATHQCFHYYDVAIFLIDQSTQELYVVAHAGAYERYMGQNYRQPLDVGILGQVARTGKTYKADDVKQDPLYVAASPEEFETRSELCIPIVVAGQVRGVLDVQSQQEHSFDDQSVMAMEALCAQIAQALEKAELYQDVRLLFQLSDKTLDLMPSSLLVLDDRFVIRRVNQRFCQEWEVRPEQVLGQPVDQILSRLSGDVGGLREIMERVRDTGQPAELKEAFCRQPDGTYRILDLHISLMQAYGETQLLMVVHNVTERVKRLYEVTRLYELGMAMRQTLDLDWLLHAILTCVTAGPGFGFNRARLFLRNTEENVFEERMWVGPRTPQEAGEIWSRIHLKSLRELVEDYQWHPPVEPPLKLPVVDTCGLIRTTVHQRQPVPVTPTNGGAELSARCLKKCLDCLSTAEEFVVVPLIANDETIGMIVADNLVTRRPITSEDVRLLTLFANQAGLAVANATIYRELEEAYHELKTTQDQLLRSKQLATIGQMAAHVAHEIRNPLVSIGGFARRIARRPGDTLETVESSGIIIEEVQRLENILKNVMDFTAPGNVVLAPGQLNEVVRDVCSLIGGELSQRQIVLQLDLQEDLPPVLLDRQQIKQVVLNLARNALEAMPQGGQLRIRTWQSPEGISLAVQDTGLGISPSDLANIFNPFFTTKRSGTGLGLAVSQKIIHEHRGEIQVDSQVGQGTTFTITLPGREVKE